MVNDIHSFPEKILRGLPEVNLENLPKKRVWRSKWKNGRAKSQVGMILSLGEYKAKRSRLKVYDFPDTDPRMPHKFQRMYSYQMDFLHPLNRRAIWLSRKEQIEFAELHPQITEAQVKYIRDTHRSKTNGILVWMQPRTFAICRNIFRRVGYELQRSKWSDVSSPMDILELTKAMLSSCHNVYRNGVQFRRGTKYPVHLDTIGSRIDTRGDVMAKRVAELDKKLRLLARADVIGLHRRDLIKMLEMSDSTYSALKTDHNARYRVIKAEIIDEFADTIAGTYVTIAARMIASTEIAQEILHCYMVGEPWHGEVPTKDQYMAAKEMSKLFVALVAKDKSTKLIKTHETEEEIDKTDEDEISEKYAAESDLRVDVEN